MAQVHADPEELRQLAAQQRAFAQAFYERHDRLRALLSQIEASSWSDRQFRGFSEEITHDLNQLREAASQIEMIAGRIERLAPPLNDYLNQNAAASAIAPAPPYAGNTSGSRERPLAGVTNKMGHPLTLLPVADLSAEEIDWNEDDFVETFEEKGHHEVHSGSDYRELASHLPEVIEHVKSGGSFDAWPSGSMQQKCHSLFFRNEVIRLDRTAEGKIDVIGGRHRLLACMQLGIDPPVSWAGGSDRRTEA